MLVVDHGITPKCGQVVIAMLDRELTVKWFLKEKLHKLDLE
ncbi:hypothetical protein [Acidithiobacillus thiooxidans]